MAACRITICGLGPGNRGDVPVGVVETLRQAGIKFLRTEKHPVVPYLREEGIEFTTFDRLEEDKESIETVNTRIAETVFQEAGQGVEQVIYAVPGHPFMEESSRLIIEEAKKKGIGIRVLPAMSILEAAYAVLGLDLSAGMIILDALRLERKSIFPSLPAFIMQVYNQPIATKVKLLLKDHYPGSHQITVIRAPGVPGEEKRADIGFSELDKLSWLDHLTVVYVPPAVHSLSFTGKKLKEYLASCAFDDQVSRAGGSRYSAAPLVYIMAVLRGEGGCPWDKEQTHETLKKYLVEEAYEVLEAIEQGKPHNLCEELGDLLLQIIFHCQIASETGAFDFGDVIETLVRKLIFRHPHVFGGTHVRDSEEVKANWERLKDTEKPGRFAFSGIPRSLPALVRATKIQEEASRAGFDWDNWRGAMTKVQEEAAELAAAAEASEGIAGELGDLIFAIVNVARQLGLDAEELLNKSTDKFVRRFSYIEQQAREKGVGLTDLDLTQMDMWWEEAKKQEKI